MLRNIKKGGGGGAQSSHIIPLMPEFRYILPSLK